MKFKATKFVSEGLGGNSVKFCITKNFPLYSIPLVFVTMFVVVQFPIAVLIMLRGLFINGPLLCIAVSNDPVGKCTCISKFGTKVMLEHKLPNCYKGIS